MLKFLPRQIQDGLAYINQQFLYEIRLRAECPTTVNYKGRYQYLSIRGITNVAEKAIWATSEMIEDCVFKAGKYSIYAVEDQIKQGFITAEDGERIGIAGEYVYDHGKPIAIRNFTSLCIRVPHEVLGCGEIFYNICMSDKVKNILLISSPGLGKTTILRDVARLLSERTHKNILICDERGEIAAGKRGNNCDVLKFADKATGFEAGIRALKPDVFITDEISEKDCEAIKKAISAGVYVLASAHFSSIECVEAPFFPLFDCYVLLDSQEIGKIKAIYNAQKELLYDGKYYD